MRAGYFIDMFWGARVSIGPKQPCHGLSQTRLKPETYRKGVRLNTCLQGHPPRRQAPKQVQKKPHRGAQTSLPHNVSKRSPSPPSQASPQKETHKGPCRISFKRTPKSLGEGRTPNFTKRCHLKPYTAETAVIKQSAAGCVLKK